MTKTHMHTILDFPGKDPYCLDCGATGDNLATSPNDLGLSGGRDPQGRWIAVDDAVQIVEDE
jgi:hypothetical protein|tara:strand:+ start:38 stop:223 length:186 start_codon:yes stop_codon:yes gene_type:complete